MTREEWQQLLAELFPAVVGGMVRPTEPIPTDLDFSDEFPQFIRTDPVLFNQENAFLRQILSNDKLLKSWIDSLSSALAAQDFRVVTTALKGFMSPEMLNKLNGIEAGANKYVHPSTHPATMITQDTSNRFVSDTEKNTWNSKASTAVVSTTADGLAPKRDGSTTKFLRGDGTWAVPTAAGVGAAAADHTHDDRYFTETEVSNMLTAKAPLVSPALTGTPTAPTAPAATNNTQLATTAFVQALLSTSGGGIVAGSLAQNGYVKFANGLILQWGKILIAARDTQITVAFPLAFTAAYLNGQVSIASTFGVTSDAECAIFDATLSNAIIRLGSDRGMEINYLVLGI